ncbi:MAG TPA: hypothetical protein PLP29_17320 [Candidatus Ozemobacteraceae bacterium]|nr:hypothetical protein [Candidatus Ozemobacteraceae bacterium]
MAGSDVKLISCRMCGAIIMRMSRDVCQKCHLEEEERFLKVKEYLRSHPGAAVKEVAAETLIPENQINYFISSGRLERVGVIIEHTCQTCHKVITAGVICTECKRDIKAHVKQLREEIARPAPKPDPDSDKNPRRDEGGFHVGKSRK